MAATVAVPASVPSGTVFGRVEGNKRRALVTITGDASYPTGGYALTASQLGLTRLDALSLASALDVTGTWLATWVASTGKLKLFSAPGTEVVSTTDVHTAVFTAEALGL